MPLTENDQQLIDAVRTKNTDLARSLCDSKVNINCVDDKGSTLLHIAIDNDDPKIVELLLEKKAETHKTDTSFNKPLSKIIQRITSLTSDESLLNSRLGILQLLLVNRTSATMETLENALGFYFQHGLDERAETEEKSKTLIDYAVSRLTGIDIAKFPSEGHKWKYFAQLLSLRGGKSVDKLGKRTQIDLRLIKKKVDDKGKESPDLDEEARRQIDLEGWGQEHFLPMRIRSFFEIIIKIANGVINPVEIPLLGNSLSTIENRKAVLTLLKVEVVRQLETLHIRQSLLEIQKLPPKFQEISRQYLTANIINRLKSLREGEEISLAVGWQKHAIYINFTLRNGTIIIRIDNLGLGHKPDKKYPQIYHHPDTQKQDRFYSAVFEPLPCSAIDSTLASYIEKMLAANTESAEKAFPMIYQFDEMKPMSKEDITKLNYPSAKEQSVGNCPVKNHQVGLQIRLGKSEVYDLKNTEDFYQRRRGLYKYIRNLEYNFANPKRFEKKATSRTSSLYADLATIWEEARRMPASIVEALQLLYQDDVHNHIRLLFSEKTLPIASHYIRLNIVDEQRQKILEGELKKSVKIKTEMKTDEDDVTINPSYSTEERIHDASGKESIPLAEIFIKKPDKTRDGFRRILITGRAGIGKSTLCQHIANQWATGESWLSQFSVVVWIRLRNLNPQNYPPGRSYSFLEVFQQELSKPLAGWSISDELLERQLRQENVLWVLDGWDELPQPIPPQLQKAIKSLAEMKQVIITSRPEHANAITRNAEFEVVGFSNENIEEYVEKFFNEEKPHDEKLHEESEPPLLQYIKQPINSNLWGVSHIPILLEILCSIWSNGELSEKDTAINKAKLYRRAIVWLLRRYQENRAKLKTAEKKEDSVAETKEVTIRLSDVAVEAKFDLELNLLTQLAFQAIKNRVVILQSDMLQEILKPIESLAPNFLEQEQKKVEVFHDLLEIGIFKPLINYQTSDNILLNQQYYFIHLSFQEFLAAWYLARSLATENAKDKHFQIARDFIQANKYIPHYYVVLSLLAGILSADKSERAGVAIKNFWNILLSQPLDLTGFGHLRLMIICLEEMMDDSRVLSYQQSILNFIQRSTEQLLYPSEYHIHITNMKIERWSCSLLRNHPIVLNKIGLINRCINDIKEYKKDESRAFNSTKLLFEIGESVLTFPVVKILLNILINEKKDLGYISLIFSTLWKKIVFTDSVACLLLKKVESGDAITFAILMNSFTWESRFQGNPATMSGIKTLLFALKNTNQNVRCFAAKLLGQVQKRMISETIVEALLEALDSFTDLETKCYVSQAICNLGEIAATPKVFKKVLKQMSLKGHVKLSFENFARPVSYIIGEALDKLCNSVEDTSVFTILIAALEDKSSDIRFSARHGLGKINEKSANKLEPLLLKTFDEKPINQDDIIKIIGDLENKIATKKILALLLRTLENKKNVASTVKALANVTQAEESDLVVTSLLKIPQSNLEEYSVKENLADALGKLGAISKIDVIPTLLMLLKDKDTSTKKASLNAFKSLREKVTAPALEAILDCTADRDDTISRLASDTFCALQKNAPQLVDKVLAKGLESEVVKVKNESLFIAKRMADSGADHEMIIHPLWKMIEEKGRDKRDAQYALVNLAKNTSATIFTAFILASLSSKDPILKAAVLEIMGNLNVKAITKPFIQNLFGMLEAKDIEVKSAAVRMLGKLNLGEKIENFLNFLLNNLNHKNDKFVSAIVSALINLRKFILTAPIITKIIKAFQSGNNHVEVVIKHLAKFNQKIVLSLLLQHVKRFLRKDDENIIFLLNEIHWSLPVLIETYFETKYNLLLEFILNDLVARCVSITLDKMGVVIYENVESMPVKFSEPTKWEEEKVKLCDQLKNKMKKSGLSELTLHTGLVVKMEMPEKIAAVPDEEKADDHDGDLNVLLVEAYLAVKRYESEELIRRQKEIESLSQFPAMQQFKECDTRSALTSTAEIIKETKETKVEFKDIPIDRRAEVPPVAPAASLMRPLASVESMSLPQTGIEPSSLAVTQRC